MTTRDSAADALKHLQRLVSRTPGGWKQDAPGVPLRFGSFRFDGGPHAGRVTYATAGVSEQPVRSRTSGRDLRMELVLGVAERDPWVDALRALVRVGEEILGRGEALLRGDVVHTGPAFTGSAAS